MLSDEIPGFDVLLRRHREAAGWTQEDLAERADMSVRGISNLERGVRRTPYPDTVRRLADALGLTGDDRAALEWASGRRTTLTSATARPQPGTARGPAALPVQLSSFVGREREIAEIRTLLLSSRLVTLTGVGGCGKTRLALEVAGGASEQYADGVWLVELAAVIDPSLVSGAVATALEVQEHAGVPLVETLVESLQSRDLIVLLDNCEQVITACAELVQTLLRECPRVRILATSRESLRVSGEMTWRVPSLSLPEAGERVGMEQVACSEAARLFVERARALLPDFAVTDGNAAAVAQICRRLDGIPLALELAAARVPILSPEQISARLDDLFRLLAGGPRGAPARHQTLRATLDWSYGLLSGDEQSLFHRLAVFAGGFTVDAAEAVCQGEDIPGERVLEVLSGLLEKSIVAPDGAQNGCTRYRLLEPVHQYAWERLIQREELDRVQEQHAAFYLGLAEEAAPMLRRPEQGTWLQRLEREHDNLRAALRRLVGNGDILRAVRLAESLRRFWYGRGHLGEARRWATAMVTEARASAPEDATLARALELGAELATDQGDYALAVPLAEEGLTLYRRLGDRRGTAFCLTILGAVAAYQAEYDRAESLCVEALHLYQEIEDTEGVGLALNNLGLVARERGENERAVELYVQSLDLQRRLGDVWTVALVLDNLAEVVRDGGDSEEAAALYEEALRLRRELGDVRGIADTLSALASVALSEGSPRRAARLFRESLTLYRRVGDRWRSAVCLEGLARAAAAEGEQERAAELFAAASYVRDSIGHPVSTAERASYERDVDAVRRELGEARFTAAWLAGTMGNPEELAAAFPQDDSEEGDRVGGQSMFDVSGH